MKSRTLLLSLSILAAAAYPAANRLYAQAKENDEAQIRALEERYAAAFRAKDIDMIMKAYAPGAELFVFDVTPPHQHVGFDDYKKDWQDLFAAFPGPVDKFEVQDLSITTDGKLRVCCESQGTDAERPSRRLSAIMPRFQPTPGLNRLAAGLLQ